MSSQKTKIQLMSFNPNMIEHDLVDVSLSGLDLVGAIDNGGGYAIGSTSINLDGFTTQNIPIGCVIGFGSVVYYVSYSEQRGGVGSGQMTITIDPPLRVAVANNDVATIYPFFDITTYVNNELTIRKSCEYKQNELLLDPNLKFDLFNKSSVFYDRDTWTTAYATAAAYFTTRNTQNAGDNQFVKISWNRNSGGYKQKYAGKVVRHTLQLNELARTIGFETETVFNSFKDLRMSEIADIYNCHRYTTSTRKTKTISGQVVEIIRKMCNDSQGLAIGSKSYTITNKVKTNHTCTLTAAGHSIQVGELITVNISDSDFDLRNAIVTAVTTNTFSYKKEVWSVASCLVDHVGGYSAAETSVYVDTPSGLSAPPTTSVRCSFAGHSTVYEASYTKDPPFYFLYIPVGLTSGVANNEAITVAAAKNVASTNISVANGATQYRVIFDITTDYFNHTHQGYAYDILDCWFITQKWRKKTVDESSCFDVLSDFCKQFNAVAFTDYISGIPYAYFRSKINTSSSKITLTQNLFKGDVVLKSNWQQDTTPLGTRVYANPEYWDGQSMETEAHYYPVGVTQRYTSGSSVFEIGSESFECDAATCQFSVGDYIKFRDDSTRYLITGITSDTHYISPPLNRSLKKDTPISLAKAENSSLLFVQEFKLKLKMPDLFVGNNAGSYVRHYSDGSKLRQTPFTDYVDSTIYTGGGTYMGVGLVQNVPIAGQSNFPCGDSVMYSEISGGNLYVKFGKILNGLPTASVSTIFSGASTYQPYMDTGYITKKADYNGETGMQVAVFVTAFDIVSRFLLKMVDDSDGSADSANLDHFGLYAFEELSGADRVNLAARPVQGIYVNENVLNPDMDGYLWFCSDDTPTSTQIGKQLTSGSDTITYPMTGTDPIAVPYGFQIAHGESGAEKQYLITAYSNRLKAIPYDSLVWASVTNLAGGGATKPATGASCAATSLDLSSTGVQIWKAYENIYALVQPADKKVYLLDNVTGTVYCIYTDGANQQVSITGCDFISWWLYPGSDHKYLDITYNASYLQYQFYNQSRRESFSEHTDLQLSYLEYTLLDRFSIDDALDANDSGDPLFYVYDYEINMITHEHKLHLLESVE